MRSLSELVAGNESQKKIWIGKMDKIEGTDRRKDKINPVQTKLRISSRIFENIPTLKRARIFAQEPGDSQVSGPCGEKKHRGLAVLVGSLSSSVPELTRHGLERDLHVNP